MATRGVQTVVVYTAWDTLNQVGVTGDAANHTLRWIKDGAASAPTNAVSEIDATNLPGEYKITLTATETDCLLGVIGGKSTTANVVILSKSIGFEDVAAIKAKTDNLPASPAAVGDIPTANENADALLDRIDGIEAGWTLRQVMRIIAAVFGGKATVLSDTSQTFRDLNDSKDRVVATGSRSSVTLDAS